MITTVIKNIRTSLTLRASPAGTAIGALNNEESIKIITRASSQVNGYYWDTILSNKSGLFGYAARIIGGDECIVSTSSGHISSGSASDVKPEEPPVQEPEEPKPIEPTVPKVEITKENVDEYVKTDEDFIDIHPEVKIENILMKYEDATITDSKGNNVTEGALGTGYKVKVGEEEYTVVKKGDVDGDTEITIIDAVVILNAIKGNRVLENEYKEASIVNGEEECSIIDAVLLLNYIKGTVDLKV